MKGIRPTEYTDVDDSFAEDRKLFGKILELQPINRTVEHIIKLKLRREDTVLAFLGTTAIVIGLIEEDRFYRDDYRESTLGNVMRLMVMGLSLISCALIVRRYRSLLQLQKSRSKLDESDGLVSSKLYRLMLLELAINITHCPPLLNATFEVPMMDFNVTYSVNSIFAMVLLLRLYLIVRLFSEYSKFMQQKAEMVLRWHGMEASTSFAVKGFINDHPLLSVAIIFASLSVLWSVIVLLLEQPDRHYESKYAEERGYDVITKSSLKDFANCLWMVFVTTTTGNS